jgi:plasmid maintenance system antidote protein VapI
MKLLKPFPPAPRDRGSQLIGQGLTIQKSERVTIKEVAEAAGVSTATVSNVVNGTASISPATEEKVRAAICLTKWTPNLYARSLAHHRRSQTRSSG